jgi:hypothetical protein
MIVFISHDASCSGYDNNINLAEEVFYPSYSPIYKHILALTTHRIIGRELISIEKHITPTACRAVCIRGNGTPKFFNDRLLAENRMWYKHLGVWEKADTLASVLVNGTYRTIDYGDILVNRQSSYTNVG